MCSKRKMDYRINRKKTPSLKIKKRKSTEKSNYACKNLHAPISQTNPERLKIGPCKTIVTRMNH